MKKKKNMYNILSKLNNRWSKSLLVASMSAFAVTASHADTVKGKVIDQYGNPVANVEVAVKGSTYTTVTDADGNFEFDNKDGKVLKLSHADYLYQEYNTASLKRLEKGMKVTMLEKAVKTAPKTLPTAFDVKKTDSYLGSASTVYTDQLTKTMNSTLIQSLLGRMTGMTITQYRGARLRHSGENQQSTLTGWMPIFGNGTYSDNTEYNMGSRGAGFTVFVDGIERDIYAIDPDAVESVSLQKDALSTLFSGLSSSNSALHISTKKPLKEGFQISFTGRWGLNSTLKKPKPLSSDKYAYLLNEALQNDGKSAFYTADEYYGFRDNTNPYIYPNVNWFDELLNKNALSQYYNVTASGGNRRAQYFVSVGYYGENGLFKNANDKYDTRLTLERYSINSKVNINVTNDFTADIALMARLEEGNQPGGNGSGYSDLLLDIYRTPNGAYPIKNPNGTWGGNISFNNNLMAQSSNSGYITDDTRDLLASIKLKYDFDRYVKGLSVSAVGAVSVQNRTMTNRKMRVPVYYYSFNDQGDETYSLYGASETQSNSYHSVSTYQQLYGKFSVDYARTFGQHSFAAQVAGDTKQVLIDYDLPRLPSNLFQNLSYDYAKKYFVQLALTESYFNRYAHGKRWGTFWAAGLGYDLSKENFMEGTKSWLDLFKLRFVIGRTGLGGSNAGYYKYYQTYETNWFGGYMQGSAQTVNLPYSYESTPLANAKLSWEKANKRNLGVDLAFFNNRLSVKYDYFNDFYFDLLQARGKSIAILGQTYPNENIGKARRTGHEVELTWQDHAGNFNYYITANWSMAKDKLEFIDEQDQPYEWMKKTGHSSSAVFGLVAEGFFQSDAEIANSAVINGFDNIQPGDIKYKDLNGDGEINEFDRTIIGGDKPVHVFGLDYGFNWKGLEFSMLWQGVANRDLYINDYNLVEGFQTYGQHYAQAYELIQGRWTPETAHEAILPRLSAGGNSYNRGNGWNSSFWMKNGNFIRLRNVYVAYTLPEQICRNFLGGVRPKFFVSGQNLLTLSACNWVDPEVSFTSYPLQRTWSFGVNIKF